MADTNGPKRGRKYDQVLDGAMAVFLDRGFEGASVDEIAKTAGVSKATLYSYFPDKTQMFAAVAEVKFQRDADIAAGQFNFTDPPEVFLPIAGRAFLASILSEFGCSLYRITVGESRRFPDIAKAFYQNGHQLVRQILMGYFDMAVTRGELQVEHRQMAADQFMHLCKADLAEQACMGIRTSFNEDEMGFVADEATLTFLARYAKSRA